MRLGPAEWPALAKLRAAVGAGYGVLFTQATTLVAGLATAHTEGRREDKLGQLAKPKLLLIDGEPESAMGWGPIARRTAIIAPLASGARCSAIRWWRSFGGQMVPIHVLIPPRPRPAAAPQPRHHLHGDSYRLSEKRRSGLVRGVGLAGSAMGAGGEPEDDR